MFELNFSQRNSETILFIDIEKSSLDNVYSVFPINYKVHTAQTLDAAWRILRTKKIDCIFCNLKLSSGQNGIEFLKLCKSNGINIPFILIANESEKIKSVYARQNGATDVLQKPLNPEHIGLNLAKYFSSAG